MSSFESRRFKLSIIVGTVLTVACCLADQFGLLSALDDWFYDERALVCQVFSRKPDDRIVHLDIDDASLEAGAIGRWPWPRRKLARIIEEIGRAGPAAVAIDIHLTDVDQSADTDAIEVTAPKAPEDDIALENALASEGHVVIATSFRLRSVAKLTPLTQLALDRLTKDLEFSYPDFCKLAIASGFDSGGDFHDPYVLALKQAIHARVFAELDRAPQTDDALVSSLLPHADPAVVTTTQTRVLNEARLYRDREAFKSFAIDRGAEKTPVVPCQFDIAPLRIFSRHAASCGFVNCDLFPSPTLRSLPMLIESGDRLYPQFGLAFGCAIIGADVHKAHLEGNRLIIPRADGKRVEIPIHDVHSQSLGRNFSGIADIPWFGGSDWTTMYDWPTHRERKSHLSLNIVWDICQAADRIRRNNRVFDAALNDVFFQQKIDPAFAAEYAGSLPALDDTTARDKASVTALAKLQASHVVERLSAIRAADRTQAQEDQLESLVDAQQALAVADNNRGLIDQLRTLRSGLATRIAGKGVMFGWTAEGDYDVVHTSLHARCPGCVVHGAIAEAVISGRWLRRAPQWIGVLLVLLFGGVISYCVAQLNPLRALLVTALLATIYLLLNGYILYDFAKWIVPVAGPITAIGLVWSGCTLQRVILEGIERNRVATEVAIINREMELARKVQAALIPKAMPAIPTLEADGWTLAASTTGGDCYDLWALPDGRLAILLADASGHGLAPAMVVSQVRTLVRALSEVELHPHDLLKRVNARVGEDLEPGRFITAFLGYISPDGLLEYASAAHGPQFWYTENDPELHLLDSTGAPLGVDTEWLCDDPLPPIQIPEGGSLIIFSDGIFEALDPKGALFGLDRLTDLIGKYRTQQGKSLIKELIAQVQSWQQTQIPADDQTIVIARRIKPEGPQPQAPQSQ
jgi:CHASE2 domain-containing sensor protein